MKIYTVLIQFKDGEKRDLVLSFKDFDRAKSYIEEVAEYEDREIKDATILEHELIESEGMVS